MTTTQKAQVARGLFRLSEVAKNGCFFEQLYAWRGAPDNPRGHPRRATGARRKGQGRRRADGARAATRGQRGAQSRTGNDGGRDAIGSTFQRSTAKRGQKRRINRCRDGREANGTQSNASRHQQRQSSKGSGRSGESDPAAGERRAGPAALLIFKHLKSSRTEPARRHFSYC